MPEREIGIEHDPIHTVIAAGQQIAIPLSELIGHPANRRTTHSPEQNCPVKGPPLPGEDPGAA
jgi:hypothetical protein